MKIKFLAIVMTLAVVPFAHGAGDGISIDKKAHDVIQKRCTKCHGEDRINAAFTEGKDMRAIQRDMQRRGARLSGSEQEVLGIFWKKKPRAQ
jgi:uncharacterized membrane protein